MARNAVKMSENDFKDLLVNWSKVVLSHPESEVDPLEIESGNYQYYKDPEEAKFGSYVHNAMMSFHDDKTVEKIKDDLDKVKFDWENFYCDKSNNDPSNNDYSVMGIWTTVSGIPVLGCMAGGDWEHPVYFVIYPENKTTLRGYIPKEGNTWNKKTKTAYGSEEEYGFAPDPVWQETNQGPQLDIAVYKDAINKRLKPVA